MADGPPWTVGTNCNITLRHPDVFGDVAEGFYLKPDSWRVILPKVWYRGTNSSLLLPAGPIAAGKRIVDFTVLCRDNPVDVNGVPSSRTAATWHQRSLTYTGRVQDQLTDCARWGELGDCVGLD